MSLRACGVGGDAPTALGPAPAKVALRCGLAEGGAGGSEGAELSGGMAGSSPAEAPPNMAGACNVATAAKVDTFSRPARRAAKVSERNEAIVRRAFDEGPWNWDTHGLLRQIGGIQVEQVA